MRLSEQEAWNKSEIRVIRHTVKLMNCIQRGSCRIGLRTFQRKLYVLCCFLAVNYEYSSTWKEVTMVILMWGKLRKPFVMLDFLSW